MTADFDAPPPLAEVPLFSVVVTSAGSASALERCLPALSRECESAGVEVAVVRAAEVAEIGEWSERFGAVRFTAAPPGTPETELRRLGMAAVNADIVIIQRDESVTTDWITDLMQRIRGNA